MTGEGSGRQERVASSVQRLQAIMAELAKALSAVQVADVVLGHGMAGVGASGGAIGLVDAGGAMIEVVGARGEGARALSTGRTSRIEAHAPLAVAAHRGESLWIPSAEAFAGAYPRLTRAEVPGAVACVPLRRSGALWGALGFVFAEAHAFEASERAFLLSLARHCLDALDRARLHEEERRGRQLAESAAARLERMQRVAAALSGASGLAEVAGVIAREGCQGLRATCCFVAVREQDGAGRLLADSGGPAGHSARARRELLKRHMTEALSATGPRWPTGADRRAGPALASVPIAAEGRVLGALGFQVPAGRRLGREDRAFVSALAQLCGPAIERARLYEAERAARERAEQARAEAEAAWQRASEAARLKDEFLGVVSHELRTPLNAILGWASMLQSGSVRAESMPRAIDTIERNARLQARLVDDLLDASRIVSDKLPLACEAVDLRRVVEHARDSLAHAAAAKGVDLRLTLPPAGGTALVVRGDPRRLEQVVDNLVTNAIKFTPRGGAVELRLEGAAATARIEVRDTGEGIEPDVLPHIFDRFRQGDATTTRRHGGLGLGLAIVRYLVEAHGGKVGAESAGKGRGATLRVELPLDAGARNRLEGEEPLPTAAAAAIPRRLAGVRALVVDDAPDSRDVTAVALKCAGATVRRAMDAPAALALLETFDADVLVADIGLPGEDGYSLMQKVRARPRAVTPPAGTPAITPPSGTPPDSAPPDDSPRCPLPALALTAYAGAEDRAAALAAGYQDHVAKPIDPARLVDAVAALLEEAPPARAASLRDLAQASQRIS